MKLRDASTWLPNHVDRFSRLGRALGPTVVQLPPRWKRDGARLDDFLAAAADASPGFRYAVEFREPSWLDDAMYALLAKWKAALVVHDLLAVPWERTANFAYVRLHGPHAASQPYAGRYDSRRLQAIASRIRPWLCDGADVFVYFNNDQEACAPLDARELRSMLGTSAPTP